MLYGRHLGYKGNFDKALAEHEPKALELFHNMEQVKREAARFMQVKAVWQFSKPSATATPSTYSRRAPARPSTPSALDASPARTACAWPITFWMPKTAAATTWRSS